MIHYFAGCKIAAERLSENMITTSNLIYFSPTKTTKKVLEAICIGFGAKVTNHFDLTFPIPANFSMQVIDEGLAIFGIPVYSGRVPAVAATRMRSLKSAGIPAILVAVYGNREYEDALVELRDLVIQLGFIPFAAASFIGEHSYSTHEKPLAQNRPDAKDLELAKSFGAKIGEILKNKSPLKDLQNLPGNIPYKALTSKLPVSPITIEDKCDKCGICVSVCPTEAIEINILTETDNTACLLCCACVKECPTGARINDSEFIKSISQRLFDNCSVRKEPEMFF